MGSPTSIVLSQGLQTGHKFYESISQNEVNGQNPHYVRTRALLETTRISRDVSGVRVATLERCADPFTFRHLSRARINFGAVGVLSSYHQEFQSFLGNVGDEALNLAGRTQTFFQGIQSPQQAPGTPAYLNTIVQDAQALASEYNRVSDLLQRLRNKADQEIDIAVGRINNILQEYHALNHDIGFARCHEGNAFAAEDQRDALFLELSSYLDVTETIDYQPQGFQSATKHLYGPDGIALVTRRHVSQLHFTRGGTINASTTVDNKQLSGVFANCDVFHDDLTPRLHSGKLGGWLKMRDEVLPQIQEMLDQMAAVFQDEVNDIHNQGAAYHTPQELLSGSTLDPTMSWTGQTGLLRVALTDHTDGSVVTFKDIDLASVTTLDDLMKEINALPNALCTWQNGQLHVTIATPNQGFAFRGMSPDAQKLLRQLGLNNLFVSDPHHQPHDTNITGIAGKLTVNPVILADPRLVAHGLLSDNPDLKEGETGVQAADWRNLVALGQSAEQTWQFPKTGEIEEQNLRGFDYCRLFITWTAQKAETSKHVFQVAETGIQTWEERLHEAQSVDANQNRMDQLAWNEYLRTLMQSIASVYKLNQELLEIFRVL